MNNEELRRLQLVQLDIMKEIHEVCSKNGLTYYLIGGSALGAVRHKGFIPWDVDIDIAMPRKDYEALLHKFSKTLNERLECLYYESDKDFFAPHMLIALKGSDLVQQLDALNPHIKRFGIFIDVFPLDYCPEDESLRKKQAETLRRLVHLKHRKLSFKLPSDNSLSKFAKNCIRVILSVVPMRWILKRQQEVMQMYDNKPTSLICSMASHYKYEKQCMPVSVYGKPTLIKFENCEFFGPEHIEDYLKRIYGDFMKLPPINEQERMKDMFVSAKW
ncbi:MAG: LicD family protein [Bacteroidales bacterium]|nr:LicD family protein [Bacteroidales bacterium]